MLDVKTASLRRGYAALQTAMQPVLPSIAAPAPDRLDGRRWVYGGGQDVALTLSVINDMLAAYPGAQLRWRIVDAGSGQTEVQDRGGIDVEPNVSKPWVILSQLGLNPGAYDLEVTLDDAGGNPLGRNKFLFVMSLSLKQNRRIADE